MRRYEITTDGARRFVFDGERLATVSGWQSHPTDIDVEIYLVSHLFRTALGRLVATRDSSTDVGARPVRILVTSESVAEIAVRLMHENARVFETEPHLGGLDRDLLRLAGYAAPPADLLASWKWHLEARGRLIRLVGEIEAARERSDAKALARLDVDYMRLRRTVRAAEVAVEERALGWLESSYGHDDEAMRARERIAALSATLPVVTEDGQACGRLVEATRRREATLSPPVAVV